MNKNRCVFPGSFDPFTIGHEEIVRKALNLFDDVVIAIGVNSKKNSFLKLDRRIEMIKNVFNSNENISIDTFEGLTVDYCQSIGANYIVRGLRNTSDYCSERDLALCNFDISEVETIFFNSSSKYSHISSTLVREIMKSDINKANLFSPTNIDYGKYFIVD